MKAQDSLIINFDNRYFTSGTNGIGFLKLLNCPSNGLIHFNAKPHKVIFPNDFSAKDTAVAFEYFTGWKDSKTKNSTALLFGNYSSFQPFVYVDNNHNLDFSDDGLPIVFNPDTTAIIYMRNASFPHALFPVKLIYPNLSAESKVEVEKFIGNSGPDVDGNSLLSVDYWFGTKRKNYRITNTLINGKMVKVALYDKNCNGLYNDIGEDRLIIGDVNEGFLSGRLETGGLIYEENLLVDIYGQTYRVTDIELSGRFIVLKESMQALEKVIGKGDEIGELVIPLISGESRTIAELQEKNKFLLLDFWGIWCIGCTQQLPDLKELASAYPDQLQVLGLNYGDNKEKIKNYINKNKITWLNGFASDQIIKELRNDGFPRYLLLDADAKIVLFKASIKEIEELLKEQY